MKFKHPSATAESSNKGPQPIRDILSSDSPPETSRSDPVVFVENGEIQIVGNKRRGSEKGKSYTVEFKKKTLDLLDSLASSKNKYKIVSRERGVHRSLVQTWNKNRSQIFK